MHSVVVLLALICLCQARTQQYVSGAAPSFFMGGDQYIIGGSDAAPGEFPWVLSLIRGGSHSCGASLLSSTKGLTASQCVDGAIVANLRVIAGLHDRSDLSGAQSTDVSSYTMHEEYNTGVTTFSNDIAILNFATPIVIGGNVQVLTLPADNSNNYAGVTCVISGWGRVGSSNVLPDTLQKASIPVITTAQCQSLVNGVNGARVWDNHICLYDSANRVSFCNGDIGGPLNCPDGGTTVVAGIMSWGVSSGGNCLQSYPSVCTKTGAYLAWINSH